MAAGWLCSPGSVAEREGKARRSWGASDDDEVASSVARRMRPLLWGSLVWLAAAAAAVVVLLVLALALELELELAAAAAVVV